MKTLESIQESFHDEYVITPTDKAGNDFSTTWKQFDMHCLWKELVILEFGVQRKSSKTSRCLKSKPTTIVNRQALYMDKHNIDLDESQKPLPFLYWIPKMHRDPSKQRYIAASNSFSTTLCRKHIEQTHSTHCKAIFKNSGFNRMWIVDNPIDVTSSTISRKLIVKDQPGTFKHVFFLLCTPPSLTENLQNKLHGWSANVSMLDDARKFIRFGHASAHCTNTKGKHNDCWTKDDLIKHTKWLIDKMFCWLWWLFVQTSDWNSFGNWLCPPPS